MRRFSQQDQPDGRDPDHGESYKSEMIASGDVEYQAGKHHADSLPQRDERLGYSPDHADGPAAEIVGICYCGDH